MTRQEFFRWAETRDEGYEFDGEHPIPMPAGSAARGQLAANLLTALHTRLRGTPHHVLPSSGAGIATTAGRIRYPTATVATGPIRGQDRLVSNPVVVFEITSPTHIRSLRVDKMREYQALPTIRRYALIEQSSPVVVSCFRHHDEPWTATALSLGDTLALPELDIGLPVADIFEGLTFPDDPDVTTA